MSDVWNESPLAEPPHEEFWDRYNKRFEFPISAFAALLVHLAVAAVLFLVLVHLMTASPRTGNMAVSLVPDLGLEDEGAGQEGGGGHPDPKIEKPLDLWTASAALLPSPQDLPKVQDNLRRILEDDSGTLPISSANAAQYQELDEVLRQKLLQPPGAKKGAGDNPGRGTSGEKGAGPGGNAKDDSRKRSLRWVLRFTTKDGPDYVDQLAAMGAVILIPLPPDSKEALLFPDLKNRKKSRIASDEDLKKLAGQVRFSDARADSVRGVCEALGVDAKPKTFWAFFPKDVEDELLKKEIGYRNRRTEQIEETVFRIHIVNGKTVADVVEQIAKE